MSPITPTPALGKLEEDLHVPYTSWRDSPGPESNAALRAQFEAASAAADTAGRETRALRKQLAELQSNLHTSQT